MDNPSIDIDKLEELLKKSSQDILEILNDIHPADIASLMIQLDKEEQIKLITSLDHEMAGDILSQLFKISSVYEFQLLEQIPFDLILKIIEEMPSDNAADILNTLKPSVVADILTKIDPERSEVLEELLSYKEDTAGGKMTTDFLSFKFSVTVAEAISEVKKRHAENLISTYKYIFVTDEDERLIGRLPVVDLLIHQDNVKLETIMEEDPLRVYPFVDQEAVAKLFVKYDMEVLPVVNRGQRVIGRITVDDVINVINEEADDDIYKLVGTNEEEKHTPSSLKIASIRLPWLLSTLSGSFISCSIIKYFSHHVHEFLALFFFMPLITAMGGNIGVQCSTLIVRGLATGFVKMDSITGVFWKEFKIGSIISITCGIMAGLCAYFFIEAHIKIGIAVCISMMSCMLFAAITGTGVPLLFKKIGIDPAIASGPIITTFNDITGLMIYFSISIFILT